jgi:OOP family OmpA-OmpF porin
VSHAALDAALVLCLSAGAADLLALNLLVLPATRAPALQQLGAEASAAALAPPSEPALAGGEQVKLADLSPVPLAASPAPRPEPVAIVEFDLASPHVDRRALQALGATLAQLREAAEIVVIGHADASGPEQLNDQLSVRRAQAVARRLLGSGISAARIRVDARGEREPREVGNSRRVEVFVGGGP